MNGTIRLIWTYLYRCRESNSTSISKLENILKHFFPANRLGVNPPDESLEPLIYIVHFILSRHFEFGRDLTLSLLQEQVISPQSGNIMPLLAPERTNVALEAILRSLYLVEHEESTPTWPSNADFSLLPNKNDYRSSSTFCPQSVLSKPGMPEFFERCGTVVATIAVASAKAIGRMSIFDEQWSLSRLNTHTPFDEATSHIIRQHPEISVAYPAGLSGQMSVLHSCFSSWPRCLHPSLPFEEAVDMLIRCVIHVEPTIAEAASGALTRIVEDPSHLPTVLSRFMAILFSPRQINTETSTTRMPYESSRMLHIWLTVVDKWADSMKKGADDAEEQDVTLINAQFIEVETAALFLLSSRVRQCRAVAAKLLRLLQGLSSYFDKRPSSPLDTVSDDAFRMLDALLDKEDFRPYLEGLEELLDDPVQQTHLQILRQSTSPGVLLRVAESEDEKDRVLWWLTYPRIIRQRMNRYAKVLFACREMWLGAARRYHPLVVSLSGINSRIPPSQTTRSPALIAREREKSISEHLQFIEQWHMWMRLICCTAAPPDAPVATQRDHSRAPSELSPDRDLILTHTKALFRHLTPFLDAESSVFREIAVLCISSFPVEAYRELLEDLGAFSARHFYVDTSRVKMSPGTPGKRNRRQDRLYLAVAHIYQLTARFLNDQRGMARQDSLTNVLKFVRHTQAFLSSPEIRGDWQQQRLRRYFCGIVERLFDGLSSLQSSDRFIPAHMHLTLYRLCEEWCQCGNQSDRVKQRLVAMQTAATVGFPEPQQKAGAVERFQTETKQLSHAAAGAMASVCVSDRRLSLFVSLLTRFNLAKGILPS